MARTSVVFNPFTGNFDYVEKSITKAEIAKMFLLDKDDTGPYPTFTFLFDEDGLLYNDDDTEV